MLKNRDIIIFGEDWGRYPSTTQHIGRILLEKNRILWIGSLGMRKPRLHIWDLIRSLYKIKKIFFNKISENKEKFSPIIYNPPVIPLHGIPMVRWLNKKILISKLKKKIIELNFHDVIIISSYPYAADVVGNIGEKSAHYFCLDDYHEFEGVYKIMEQMESELLEKVNSVFSVSDELIKIKKPKFGFSRYLPQGVNFDHFNQSDLTTDSSVAKLKRPVIGYFGFIGNYVDIESIMKSAERYPDYTFLIIAKTDQDLSCFKNYSNIVFIGEKPFSELPKFASVMDVGLIPFKINKLTVSVNPIKLLEYFSLGIPVISTAMPEVRKFSDLTFIAETQNEFIDMIPLAVNDNSEERNQLRKNLAKKYSWTSIAERIGSDILESEIDR